MEEGRGPKGENAMYSAGVTDGRSNGLYGKKLFRNLSKMGGGDQYGSKSGIWVGKRHHGSLSVRGGLMSKSCLEQVDFRLRSDQSENVN